MFLLLLLLAPVEQPRVEAIRKLNHWVGTWKGTGWSFNETGQRFEFSLTETVQPKVSGTVLLLEGKGIRRNDKGEEIVTHDGLAIVSYDDKSKRYLWQGHDFGRESMTTELTMTDAGMLWSVPIGKTASSIRFTIKIEKDRWLETGEFSADGKVWNKFMDVTLTRQR